MERYPLSPPVCLGYFKDDCSLSSVDMMISHRIVPPATKFIPRRISWGELHYAIQTCGCPADKCSGSQSGGWGVMRHRETQKFLLYSFLNYFKIILWLLDCCSAVLYWCLCRPNTAFAQLCTLHATCKVDGSPQSLAPLFWRSRAEKFRNPCLIV